MRLSTAVLAVCCAFALVPARTPAQDFAEVFGGYSFDHASVPVSSIIVCPVNLPSCPPPVSTFHPDLNGWELAGTIKPGTWFGITADFSGHYGSVGTSSAHLQTFLLGPKLALPGPVSPFAHVLVGGAHESVGSGTSMGPTIANSGTAVAVAVGAGIDIKVVSFIAIRRSRLITY